MRLIAKKSDNLQLVSARESDGPRGSICKRKPEVSEARASRDTNPTYRVGCEKKNEKSNRKRRKEEKLHFMKIFK